MNNRVHYTHCPVCASTHINPLLTIKDHSITGENFVVWQCMDCTLRFTQDVPDATSIAPYYKSPDYISHTNTKEGLINKLYLRVRTFTLQQKAKTIQHFTKLKKGKLLDIGAGAGAFLQQMQKEGWEVTGVEPDEDARKVANHSFHLNLQDPSVLEQLPDDSFDAITMWHVLEHIHDLQNQMAHLKRLVKPNGRLFIAVPNYQSLDAHIYRLNWAGYDVPRHLYHFSPKAMHTLMQRYHLKIVAQKPMWFDSFYVSLLSSKYKNGRSINWLGAFISGLRSNINTMMNKDRCSSIIYIISKA